MSKILKITFVILFILYSFLQTIMIQSLSLKIQVVSEKIIDNRQGFKDLKTKIDMLEMEIIELENRLQAVQELTVNNSIALYGKKGIRPEDYERMNRKIDPLKNNFIPEVRE